MTGRIRGVVVNSDQGRQSAIALEQDSDGIHWSIAANNIEDQQTAADCRRLPPTNDSEHEHTYATLDRRRQQHTAVAAKPNKYPPYPTSNQ